MPKLLDPNRYHGLIVSEIETAVGGKVTLGRMSWGITHRIWVEIDGLSIVGASAIPGDVELTRIHGGLSIPQLLFRKLVFNDVRLESSETRFRLEPTIEETGSSGGGTESADAPLPFEIEIQKLVVAINRLEVDDALSLPGQKQTHVFGDVELTATDLAPGRVMAFDLSLQGKSPSGLGALKARGTFSGLSKALTLDDPNLKLKATLSTLHIDAIKPYLTGIPPHTRLGGTISTTVNYQGDLGPNMRAQGVIDLTQLTYSDPELWDSALPGRETTVTYQIILDPNALTAESINVTLGKLSLDARGVLHSWKKDPVIQGAELSSSLPLDDVAHLIPWQRMGKNADTLRATLDKGGQVSIRKLTLPDLSFSRFPSTVAELVPKIEIAADLVGVSVQPTPDMPEIQNVEGTAHLANGIVEIRGLKGRIASVDLPPISGKIVNLLGELRIEAKISGPLALDAGADEEFRSLLENIGLDRVVGAADLDLSIGLDTTKPEDFQLQGKVGLKDFLVKSSYTPALVTGLNAEVVIDPALVTVSRASAIVGLSHSATSQDDHFKVDIQGQIDDWRGEPTVALQNFKTSRVSLPLMASMIPWKELGQSAALIKEILVAGGDISIDASSFPAVELSMLSKDPKHLLPRLNLSASLIGLTVPRGLSPTRIEGITGRVDLENDVLVAENLNYKIGPFALPVLNIRATGITDQLKLSLRAKGPLEVAADGEKEIEKLLLKHGLKHLSVSGTIDMSAEFDQHKPEQWTADGSLVLHAAHLQTRPAAVTVDDVKGKLSFSRAKNMNLTAQNVSARINRAPIRLSGSVLGIGSPGLLVSGTLFTRRLDLSHLAELLPELKSMKPAGIVDMDVELHVPFSAPKETRLKGTLTARDGGFRVTSSNLEVAKGNLNLQLVGNRANIEAMTMQINDQEIALSGHVANPQEPRVEISVTSPNLNLDRLLSFDEATKSSMTASKSEDNQGIEKSATDKKSGKEELPPMAKKLTADLHVKADRGQYKGLQFEQLKMDVSYKRGVVERYEITAKVDEGQVATKGSADLRNLDRIGFTANPNISALPLDVVAPILGIDNLPIIGPLTLRGPLRGHTGSTKDMLESLDGTLIASLGPGILNNAGKAGDIIAKLSAMASIESLFSGRLFKDLTNQGIPFETLNATASFGKGTLSLNNLHFSSDAMTVDGHGRIDLLKEVMKIEVILVPLATIDKALEFVPIVGKELEDVTKVHIDVVGPLDDPEIHTAEVKSISKDIESEIRKPMTILEDVGKELKEIF